MEHVDTLIIGGGPAGLSAALSLGRSRRNVLVVDSGQYRNDPAAHAHNVLTHDGSPPAEIRRLAREELAAYPGVSFAADRVEGISGIAGEFTVTLGSGGTVGARTVVFASGVSDTLPDIPGMAELWGTSVFHCPYCHGWEVRDGALAIYAPAPALPMVAGHMAPLIRNLSADVVVLSDGPSRLDDEGRAALHRIGVRLDERPVARLAHDGRHLSAIVFTDGSELPRTGMVVGPAARPNTALAEGIGCEVTTEGMLIGHLKTDMIGRMSVDGIFGAGDSTAQAPSVSNAIASGSMAGAGANAWLATNGYFAATAMAPAQ
ncbi:MAG TPA: NAD(P)/FAD-dependent oxidoreductase [Thermomicrobiales bacterium]|jgi:thioredoxin reductase|nr:NAD(P)/FAD-dependent oxidoreductase [Thermomicrobiales bacterium]